MAKRRSKRVTIYSIYTIRDELGNVRYVGLTTNKPRVRLQGHHAAKTPIGMWVRAELEAGRRVSIVVEEEFRRVGEFLENYEIIGQAHATEKKYIAGYRRLLGDKLLNREGPRNKMLSVAKADTYCEQRLA